MEVPTLKDPEPINFCTGSSYIGNLDDEGKMTGYGIYRYPNGTEYRGHFKEGAFHGKGMIIHQSKFKLCGNFIKGKCDSYETFFGDGLRYEERNWKYCTPGDRRYWIEIVQGISPVGESFVTKEKPTRAIPKGLYDTEEGYFDPKSGYVIEPETGGRLRYVCPDEKTLIMEHYRMNADDFQKQEENAFINRNRDVSTDSWISTDSYEDDTKSTQGTNEDDEERFFYLN